MIAANSVVATSVFGLSCGRRQTLPLMFNADHAFSRGDRRLDAELIEHSFCPSQRIASVVFLSSIGGGIVGTGFDES